MNFKFKRFMELRSAKYSEPGHEDGLLDYLDRNSPNLKINEYMDFAIAK